MSLLLLLILLVLGLIVGSFLSVAIHRLHAGKPGLVWGRSSCPHCHHALSPQELIPLLSYLWQGGQCRHCAKRIGWHYPVLEIATALVFVGMGAVGLAPLSLYLLYGAILVFIFFYDLKYMEIPDEVMLPSLAVALIGSFHAATPSLGEALSGAAIVTGFFILQILLSRGKWLGGGDLRIGAFLGLILGLKLTLVAVFLSYLIGSVISIGLMLTGRLTRKSQVPFGPFLVLGTLMALFYGDVLIGKYLEFIGI